MLSQRFKDDFLELINSDYTALDFILFLKDNDVAQKIISEYCDIDQAVRFIGSHDESEIKKVLDTPHHEFYDPDFGSMDPLTAFRIRNKKDIENFEEYLQEGDDPLLWIKRAIDDDKDDTNNNSPSRKFINDFECILSFQASIPSVCNILIGNNVEDGWVAAIQDHETNDFTIDSALKAYDAFIEPSLDYDGTVDSIDIKMPLCDWSYDDIQELYFYISTNFHYDDRKASFAFNRHDEVNEVDIQLYNSLYKINISIEENFGEKSLKISIIRQMDEIETYQALNTLLSMDKPNPRVYVTIEEILHVLYSRLKANDKNE